MRLAPLFVLAFAAAASAQAPDTLDWHRYYPLAVGNAWEYHDAEMWDVQVRHTLVADTVAGGRTYFVRRTDAATAVNGPAGADTLRSTAVDYVRYDDGGVVVLASLGDDAGTLHPCAADGFERDLTLGFGARRLCDGSATGADSVFVDGEYHTIWQPDVLSGSAPPVDVAAVKQFATSRLVFSTFVADIGPVRTGNLGGPSLHFAVVDGVPYGTPEMGIAEPGGPLTATDAAVALPDDLTFTLANLTSAPVVLDSLAMRFGGSEREFDGWSFTANESASATFDCSFYRTIPRSGPDCSTPVVFPAGAVVRADVFYTVCSICDGRAGSGAARGFATDTLLVYSGGASEPDIVLFDASGYVGTTDAPEPGALAVAVGPNPSRGAATVTVTAAAPEASVRVELVDALGRRVAVLHDGALPADARFTIPPSLPAGVYTVRAETGGSAATARLTVVR